MKRQKEGNLNQALRHLRVADLELFITAALLGNLGKAAAHHHLSQSAASTAIQRVEAAFNRSLCTHEKRQFSLTKEGMALLPRAEAWIRQLRENVAKEELLPIRIRTTQGIARVITPITIASDTIDLKLMRPDAAYAALLRDEADVAIVLDNSVWEGVEAVPIGKGLFQLYSKNKKAKPSAVLLPEDQMEVLALQQRWQEKHQEPLPVHARIPSWSLIADICSHSEQVGFLPDFLTLHTHLHPVSWQPLPIKYRMLVLYRRGSDQFQKRLQRLIRHWRALFARE